MRLKPFTPSRYRSRVFSQLWMLSPQFILGMFLNLIGTGQVMYRIILIAHILNAIGLVEGSIYIALKVKNRLSWSIVLALCTTSLAGMLTFFTKQDSWSFVMACGLLASSWLTVIQYIQADRGFRSDAIDK